MINETSSYEDNLHPFRRFGACPWLGFSLLAILPTDLQQVNSLYRLHKLDTIARVLFYRSWQLNLDLIYFSQVV
jgi:hypothetical protein